MPILSSPLSLSKKKTIAVDTPYENSYADQMEKKKRANLLPPLIDPLTLSAGFQNLQRLRNIQIRLERIFGTGGWTPQDVEYATEQEDKEFPMNRTWNWETNKFS